MIRNERQYRVTQSERDKLLSQLTGQQAEDVPEWVSKVNRDAVSTQVMTMDEELAEYDALRVGAISGVTEVGNLADLPRALIRARIAGRLTQRELADRLGLREQQIQRYEAVDYAGASIARLEQVMLALGVTFHGELTLPENPGGGEALRRTLAGLNFTPQTVTRRFFGATSAGSSATSWMNAAARAARIFGTDIGSVMTGNVTAVANTGAFRASTVANRDRLNGYARYAEYLAQRLAVACTTAYRPLPAPSTLRNQLGDELADQPLPVLLRVCWEHGIPVLPLADPGAFYGACWFFDDRPIIALKNAMHSPDRWAFLLAHEMEHSRDPDQQPVLEQDLPIDEWRQQPAEQAADAYATELLLGTGAEAMVRVAVDRAGGDAARLKSVVPDVAAAAGVSTGLLADHVAFRIASSGINWWATGNRLHPSDVDAWRVTRAALFDYVDLSRLDELDRDILIDGIGP